MKFDSSVDWGVGMVDCAGFDRGDGDEVYSDVDEKVGEGVILEFASEFVS